jgi:uncharacterized BrkB/YihY/UPF0761 family membrane protein
LESVVVLGVAAGLLAVGAVIQTVRKWLQGDRMPALVILAITVSLLLLFGSVILLYAVHHSSSPN